ncbi:MAG: DsrE family protein [bacterium]
MLKISGIKRVAAVAALLMCFSTMVYAGEREKLFVNLTSDDIDRAAMAINFSTRVLTKKDIPVTIFLNVEGVRIADKNIPGHQHAKGKSLKEMLVAFIDQGGKVIVCPMCMQNVGGMSEQDLIDGAVVGDAGITWPAMFDEDTTVLSY